MMAIKHKSSFLSEFFILDILAFTEKKNAFSIVDYIKYIYLKAFIFFNFVNLSVS